MTQFDRARFGDGSAWTEIFHACYPRALAAAEPVCPDWCEPSDPVADAFLNLVKDSGDLDFGSFDDLMAWLEAEVHRSVVPG